MPRTEDISFPILLYIGAPKEYATVQLYSTWSDTSSTQESFGLVYFSKYFVKCLDSPSHRILRHMHEILNIGKKVTNYTV